MFRSIFRIGLGALLFVVGGVGATSTSAEAMPRYLTISPSSVTVAPGASQTFTLSGTSGCCIFNWKLITNASGGTITAAGPFRALYTAGEVGGVIDQIQATEPSGESARAIVTVSTLLVSPSRVTLPPLGSQVFSVSGGSGAGYVWAFVTNASGGSVTVDGAYTAGSEGDRDDVLRVTDSVGNTAPATVRVTTALALSPSSVSLAPLATESFTALGGSGTGFVWRVVTNASGGEVSPAGVYTAGTADGIDVVAVMDSLGASAIATVTVSALRISPSSATLAPRSIQTFAASGGSGTGYVWEMVNNASGGALSAVGEYQAGARGDVTDVVVVRDSTGASATVDVKVTAALEISPSAVTLTPEASQTFTASGGSGVYTWVLATNASGGSLSAAGIYTAGSAAGVTDIVEVKDSLGANAPARVTVNVVTGCGVTGSGALPLLALALLPLVVSRRRKECNTRGPSRGARHGRRLH
jgi:hypothetical protein